MITTLEGNYNLNFFLSYTHKLVVKCLSEEEKVGSFDIAEDGTAGANGLKSCDYLK